MLSLTAVLKDGATDALTASVNVCATEPAVFCAPWTNVSLPMTGTHAARVPVPFPLSLNVAHAGRPVWLRAGAGTPVAATENDEGIAEGTVSLFALVNADSEVLPRAL